jgi:hypothetical protein
LFLGQQFPEFVSRFAWTVFNTELGPLCCVYVRQW